MPDYNYDAAAELAAAPEPTDDQLADALRRNTNRPPPRDEVGVEVHAGFSVCGSGHR